MKVDLGFNDHLHHQDIHIHNTYHLDRDEDDQMDVHDGMGNTKAEMRKSNKPIMEKRRRARINNCLNELKSILLEAMRKDPARHSKLEKADILELTVRHLQNVQRNQLAVAMATDPTVLLRFKNGFSECATEIGKYIGKLDGVDSGLRHRLSGHLGSCVNGLQQVSPFGGVGTGTPRYSTAAGVQFVPSKPMVVVHDSKNSLPQQSFAPTGTVIQPSGNNPPAIISHPIEDVNNNAFIPQTPLANSINSSPASAFTTVARRPPTPLESPILMSPPSSVDNLNVSVSLSSGSDSSSCAGTTPNISQIGVSPIDFSLKIKDRERTVRVLKVEPMMFDDLNSSISKGSMWRPW